MSSGKPRVIASATTEKKKKKMKPKGESAGPMVGTALGTTFAVVGFVVNMIMTFVIFENFYQFLLFDIWAFIGGYGLGNIKSRKALENSSYRMEYTLYITLGFVASILHLAALLIFNPDLSGKLVTDNPLGLTEFPSMLVVFFAAIAMQLGFGLLLNNLRND